MLNQKMIMLLSGVCALLLSTTPAFAQSISAKYSDPTAPGSATDPNNVMVTRDNNSGSRLNRQTNEERRQEERRRRAERGEAVAPTNAQPAEILIAAQALATSAGLDCRMTEASHPGVDATEAPIYEAACADGPGYLLIASTPTQSISCFELAGAAAMARLGNPRAQVGQQCELPANQNSLSVIGNWAREAGVTCQVDQAVVIGKSSDNNTIYEIGCGGDRGYWLERADTGWTKQDCLQRTASGESCLFVTARE